MTTILSCYLYFYLMVEILSTDISCGATKTVAETVSSSQSLLHKLFMWQGGGSKNRAPLCMHQVHIYPKGWGQSGTWAKHRDIWDEQKGTRADQRDIWTDKRGTWTDCQRDAWVASVPLWCDIVAEIKKNKGVSTGHRHAACWLNKGLRNRT